MFATDHNITRIARKIRGLGRLGVVWGNLGLDLLLPPRCANCSADLADAHDRLLLCADCREALAPAPWPFCQRCGTPSSGGNDPCQHCPRSRKSPLEFDAVVPLGAYRDELRRAVLAMKQPAGDSLSTTMGRLYCSRRADLLGSFEPDLVAPVPMHWTRRLVRGTNSAEIIAGQLARRLNLPMLRGMLVRRRNTKPQAGLSPRERFRNVHGAFGLGTGYDIGGARAILVDDILTTGATCSEAAKVLKQAGAKTVVAAVLARAPGTRGQ